MFKNRKDAGEKLAAELKKFKNEGELIILALPRGGVPVAFEAARRLKVPLDIFIVRKLGVPGQEELAMGAIATGGIRIINEDVVQGFAITDDIIARTAAAEQEELMRREQLYRKDIPHPSLKNKIVIVIDDGLATGASMKAAILAIRTFEPKKIIAAVPVASERACEELAGSADEMVCLNIPENFKGVGEWYDDFSQISDEEVQEFIQKIAEA
jgi:putative phosphoribosyl transferase